MEISVLSLNLRGRTKCLPLVGGITSINYSLTLWAAGFMEETAAALSGAAQTFQMDALCSGMGQVRER
jgi:hypothetical protein